MDVKEFAIALFNTTQAAMKAEKELKNAGLNYKLIPVPRNISSNCGISLIFDIGEAIQVKILFTSKDVPFESIRSLDNPEQKL